MIGSEKFPLLCTWLMQLTLYVDLINAWNGKF